MSEADRRLADVGAECRRGDDLIRSMLARRREQRRGWMRFDDSAIKAQVEAYADAANARDHFHLGKFVESLKYWGAGDEGAELFLSTCGLAYQMYGIGDTWKAVLLASWAAEMCEGSEEYAHGEDDFVTGEWGCHA